MKGGGGVWGQMPMPPNSVTLEEAKKLVQWVLSKK
jgi:cytochrome c